jgi:hypothetical protein
MTKLSFLAAIAVTGSLYAQSPPPPPTPAEASQKKESASEGINTESNLLKQVTILLKEHNEAAERQRQKDGDKATSDWWLVGFTGALTFFGLVQLFALFRQANYMREGLRETRRSADAANTSANAATQAVKNAWDALLTLERAVVKPGSVTTIHQGKEAPVIDHTTGINFKIKNFGRTVAYSVAVTGFVTVGDARDALREGPGFTIGSQGHIFWNSRSVGMWLNRTALQLLIKEPTRLGYEILITYRDVFDREHHCKASGRWNPVLLRFDIIDDTSD